MKTKARYIRLAIVIIGLPLAFWIAPSGLLTTPPGSWSLEQIYRGAAAFVLFCWTIIFAVNVRGRVSLTAAIRNIVEGEGWMMRLSGVLDAKGWFKKG